jgi:hypothetical protein
MDAETQIDLRRGEPLMLEDTRGKLGTIVLTSDRILFTQQKFASTTGGGALAALVAGQLQKRSERKAGGPLEVCALTEIRGGAPAKRKFLPDLYEFTLDDGSSFRVSLKTGEAWEPTIRGLLAERHGRTAFDEGDGSWRVK